ncbi:FHA domain-containing protein [Leifsonia sp. H3M29-4]|uniref:FHA domain-containing protein n=1 Tax=Salinibacterium metalliresistens TaxID=3031321 RepID=UPI0023DCAAD0|nr:FHA domain-containing protein [Salinibacterium metalliresistens]MDF1479356.1 FHA domain-containing protein [Salinibacterium metalliresistens]
MAEDDSFIGLPPGMAPPVHTDSGTVRRERPDRSRTERDEIVFFPAAPGAPVVPPSAPAEDTIHDVPVAESAAPRRAARAWRLIVPGHPEPIVVDGTVFLGRNPAATPGVTATGLLALDDPAKSVSKTHAMLEVDATGLWVHDLDSTNGVWVVPAEGEPVEVVPGRRIEVPADATLELGDFVIRVEHA